jgi:hypothetical protein
MKSPFWFVVTIILLVCLTGAAIVWLGQPPAVQAALSETNEAKPDAMPAAVEPVQPLANASPVVQVAVALFLGLFGVISMMPVLKEEMDGTAVHDR